MKYRFIPHPDDELDVDLNFNGKFNEIRVYITTEEESGYSFITQVNDRLTVKDNVLKLYYEYVNKDQLKEYILKRLK